MAAQHASTLLFVRLVLLPSAHAATCLRSLDVQPVYGLVEKTPRDLLMMRNFGQKSFCEIREKLATLGLPSG